MKKVLASLFVAAMAVALPAAAQMTPHSIDHVLRVKVKDGMRPQFEAGVKKLRAWQKEHHYPFAGSAWRIITGRWDGQYMFVTMGRDWKDFDESDKFGPGESPIVMTDIAPYVKYAISSFWRTPADLNLPPQAGQAPPKLMSVVFVMIKPGSEESLESVIKAANAAIQKSHWTGHTSSWHILVNGGEGPQWALTTFYKNWADFAPPATTFGKMLTGVYGKEGAHALGKKFDKSVVSVRSEILRYDHDLSYTPPSM